MTFASSGLLFRTTPRVRESFVWLPVVLAVLAASALALRWNLAQDLAYTDSAAALAVRSSQPMALGAMAEFDWALGNYGPATLLAKRAAAVNPMNGAGYRVLAQVSAARGEHARAEQLMQLALRRTPGDMTARRWLADRALAAGDWTRALAMQDRLLRQTAEGDTTWFEEWTALMQRPHARAAMVSVLASAPPWRPSFLSYFAEHASSTLEVDELLGAVPRRTLEETAAWVTRMVADGRWNSAYALWRQTRSKDEFGVVNGDFEGEPGLPPFDWLLKPAVGVQVALAPADGRSGNALRVQFLGRRVAFKGVQQTLLSTPGRHTLSWKYQMAGLVTSRGVRWVLSCASSGTELGISDPMAGQTDWQEGAFDFEIPAGCPAVTLRLELAARIAAETQAYGTAWFDDIRLDG